MHEITNKLLPEPCKSRLTSYCPSMDLVATVSVNYNVDVWRFNGQRVFGLINDGDAQNTVEAIAWRSDGQFLAIARSNGVLQLVNTFSGKIAHRLQYATQSDNNKIQSSETVPSKQLPEAGSLSLSWTTHFANAAQTRTHLEEKGSAFHLDDLLGLKADRSKLLKVKPNLPRELASLDVETSLPKLSALPATGADDDVFGSRKSIDTIFHGQNTFTNPSKPNGDTIDVLLIGRRSSQLILWCFDSFEIGNISTAHAMSKDITPSRILRHVSHPYLSTLFVIFEAIKHSGKAAQDIKPKGAILSYHVLGLNLRFISQTAPNLSLLATKATQLQNLQRYLSQIHTQLVQEITSAFDLPSRFLRNINESLAEQDEHANFSTAVYHLVVTGECNAILKEWLVDEVGERGLKRWEKAMGDCLDMVRRMTSECLLPALERYQVVLSRLGGLSGYSGTATKLGLDENSIKSVHESIDMLNILSEDLLRDVCVEIREFGGFMRWLKWEAETEALGEDSERAEELRESYLGEVELRMVLEYTKGALQKSRILQYFDNEARTDTKTMKDGMSSVQSYSDFKRIRCLKPKHGDMPKFSQLLDHLASRSKEVFARIAETLRKNVLSSWLIELPKEMNVRMMDIRVIPSQTEQDLYCMHVLGPTTTDGNELLFATHRMKSDSNHGLSLNSQYQKSLRLPLGCNVLDVKFIDDDAFLVLTSTPDDRRILWHPVQNEGKSSGEDDWDTRHVFDQGQMANGMKPSEMYINGRKGRRAVVVTAEGGVGYVVLDVDSDMD